MMLLPRALLQDINAGMDQTQPGFGYAGQFGSYFGDECVPPHLRTPLHHLVPFG